MRIETLKGGGGGKKMGVLGLGVTCGQTELPVKNKKTKKKKIRRRLFRGNPTVRAKRKKGGQLADGGEPPLRRGEG